MTIWSMFFSGDYGHAYDNGFVKDEDETGVNLESVTLYDIDGNGAFDYAISASDHSFIPFDPKYEGCKPYDYANYKTRQPTAWEITNALLDGLVYKQAINAAGSLKQAILDKKVSKEWLNYSSCWNSGFGNPRAINYYFPEIDRSVAEQKYCAPYIMQNNKKQYFAYNKENLAYYIKDRVMIREITMVLDRGMVVILGGRYVSGFEDNLLKIDKEQQCSNL